MSAYNATPGITAPVLATAAGIAGATIGVWLTGARHRAWIVVPFSAGLLLGVALFGIVPELAVDVGWPMSAALFAVGYGALLAINRYVYRVCPTCAHDHDHGSCTAELHGFAAPLLAAAMVHSFLDGWSIATVQEGATIGLRIAVPFAVALHKIPEGMALGGILRASVKSRRSAAVWAILAEATTLAGGALGLVMGPHLGLQWVTYPLGIAAGWLVYLGYHAVHEAWKTRGTVESMCSAVAGLAGAALMLRGVAALAR